MIVNCLKWFGVYSINSINIFFRLMKIILKLIDICVLFLYIDVLI